MIYRDRIDAGKQLALRLSEYAYRDYVLVLALPRGGVPVAYEVAKALHAPLDIFLVRKLGVPGHEELAMGAIASGGVRVLNHALVRHLGIPLSAIERVTQWEQQEILRRERLYREGGAPLNPAGRRVVLVDDGLATGATMLAAVRAIRVENPERIVVAVPVASKQACDDLGQDADEVVCAATPEPFASVGAWYEDFTQTSDDEVRDLLELAARQHVP